MQGTGNGPSSIENQMYLHNLHIVANACARKVYTAASLDFMTGSYY